MGDFAASDLTRPDGLYPDHAGKPCAGCNGRIDPDDRCYADGSHIWHSGCWPSTDGGLESLIRYLGRWKDPVAAQQTGDPDDR